MVTEIMCPLATMLDPGLKTINQHSVVTVLPCAAAAVQFVLPHAGG